MTTIRDERSETAEDMIVHNLIEALEHLREDLKRVELWIAALGQFQAPVSEQPIHPAASKGTGAVAARAGRN